MLPPSRYQKGTSVGLVYSTKTMLRFKNCHGERKKNVDLFFFAPIHGSKQATKGGKHLKLLDFGGRSLTRLT
jgi:hypothetical protein